MNNEIEECALCCELYNAWAEATQEATEDKEIKKD